jgi:hypothetical protein
MVTNPAPVPVSVEGWTLHTDAQPPKGLTKDGLKEFERVTEEEIDRLVRRLGHELTLHWLSLNLDGPEILTCAGVRAAHAALQEKDRREIIEEVRAKQKSEIVAELQQAKDQNEVQARRADHRRVGSVLIALSTATTAVMALPSGSLWLKAALVTVAAIGSTLVTWAPRG